MESPDVPLDLRATLAEIDRNQADMRKLRMEVTTCSRKQLKPGAETVKLNRDRLLAPLIAPGRLVRRCHQRHRRCARHFRKILIFDRRCLAAAGLLALVLCAAAPDQKFDTLIHPADLGGWLKHLAAEPNQVGSPHDKANAEYELALFREWGWDAHIETFSVLYPTPRSETLKLIGPERFDATLQEPPVPGDASSTQVAKALPAYVAYQGDGDVTAPLVYVNYGLPEDYRELARLGVDVRGRMVIARYGSGWRGLKPRLAQEHGAVGCLIYSDPSGDGYAVNDTYPNGPMRPPGGIQRGSVADMTLFPGDPLTTGLAAGEAPRTRETAPTILKIPVLPISYADAQHFLAALGGPVAPAPWRGALPITYHIGPGRAEAHMAVQSDWQQHTIYDVIATQRGAELPDQWILRGNHHDGWVFGASDPLSGQVALMAEAQAIGGLVRQGWRPKRTLVYASWDAEEPMLVGSTAWTQKHADELRAHAILYVNTDTNGRGVLEASGSYDLAHVVSMAADAVTDPETKGSVGARARAKLRVDALDAKAEAHEKAMAKRAAKPGGDLPLEALGSGSDYSAFVAHIGVPSVNLQFAGEGNTTGVYHSLYDTFEHHSRFVDPGFAYDALLARVAGRVVLAASEAALPIERAEGFADSVAQDLNEVKALLDTKRQEAETRATLLRDRAFELVSDPTRPLAPPEALDPVPYLDLAPLENAVARLDGVAANYDAAVAARSGNFPPEKRAEVQAAVTQAEFGLLDPAGLPVRPWYRNLIMAPGRFTGYGAKTLPGVREAIEERRWADADRYAALTATALDRYADGLKRATAVLRGN